METWIAHANEVLIEGQAEERIAEQRRRAHSTKSYSHWLETAMEKGARVAQRWKNPDCHLCCAPLGLPQQHHTAAEHAGTHGGMGARWDRDTESQHFPPRHAILDIGTSAPYLVKHERKPRQRCRWLDPEMMLRFRKKAIEGLAKVMPAMEESLSRSQPRCGC